MPALHRNKTGGLATVTQKTRMSLLFFQECPCYFSPSNNDSRPLCFVPGASSSRPLFFALIDFGDRFDLHKRGFRGERRDTNTRDRRT